MVKLKNRLPQIIAQITPRTSAALHTSAEAVKEGARERVPVGDPDVHLRDHIHVEQDGPLDFYVVAGDEDVFYGHLVEHGTTHSAPRPFLVPALEDHRETALATVATTLRKL